ncbi:energy-coupling factor transporter transmembrane component T [Ureaplasma canigenitalium]|uniref:energy-coupling factor transporter transmembrane component T n=1 Tax=Ureaplasma canigenitalium TaxID=42092 RepID=UPI0004E0E881|nr:energy-coupling factor transporter transmembrane component T [Ureaplasma canigenitalium]
MSAGSYIIRNSVIHRLNPAIKFVSFIFLIAMIFLPLGFFAQLIIGVFILIIFFLAKLPKRILWNIFKSAVVLFVILLAINWITYKDPVAIFNIHNHSDVFLGRFEWVSGPINKDLSNLSSEGAGVEAKHFNLVSNIWGGEIKGYISGDLIKNLIEKPGYGINQFMTENRLTVSKINSSFTSLNEISQANFDRTYSGLEFVLSNKQTLPYSHLASYLASNSFNIEGVKYQGITLSGVNNDNGNEYTSIILTRSAFSLSPIAIQLATYITIKIFLMITLSSILTSTTSSIELTNGLEDLFSPFKIFGLPVSEASMMIAIALRFIPSLLDESKRILNAQASRGVDFKNGGFRQKVKSLIALIVPLFSIAFRKAEDLANAMEARSYNPRYARTRYRLYPITFIDCLLIAILCMMVGFMISLSVIKLYFTPFGIFEASALFS